MTLLGGIRGIRGAILLGGTFALGLAGPMSALGAGAAPRNTGTENRVRGTSAISLHVSAGYGNIYRGTNWTPIRVTVHNGGGTVATGTLDIPQSNQGSSVGATALFHGLYQSPLTVSAGSTKQVTVYVPGSGVQGRVEAYFRRDASILASGTTYPIGIDSSALLIGVLSGGPADAAWIAPAIGQQVTTHVIRLTPSTLDAQPLALATFDLVVLANADTSQLDSAQIGALRRFVHDGGSLMIVGGPAWQETLRPLQTTLLPGHLAGLRVLPDLHGLRPLGGPSRPSGPQGAAVSVVTQPSGTVMASQDGVPLVVRRMDGQGSIEYVAFDPSMNPVAGWKGGTQVMEHLLSMSAPAAISRTWSPQGFRARFQNVVKSVALTTELGNLPPLRRPMLVYLALLALLYVFILGPANFVVLRRLRRQSLALLTVPVLAATFGASAYALVTHARGSSALVNSIGVVTLDSSNGVQPATFYVGMETSLPGDYRLTSGASGLPAPLPEVKQAEGFFWRNASTLQTTPLGLRLQEDPQTAVAYPSMPRWSMRDVTLSASVHLPGNIRSRLIVSPQGALAGPIYNGTQLDLLDPVIIAGAAFARLPDLHAGATVRANIRPGADTSGQGLSSLWGRLYGGPTSGGDDGFGGFRGFRDCCGQLSFPRETGLITRIQNAVSMLSQAQALQSPSEVMLVGWSDRSLAQFSVDGQSPQRRDLNLVIVPLTVQLPAHGPFQLLPGTVPAHLVDIVPRAPQSSCCGFGPRGADQQVSVGAGGSLTFEFDVPAQTRLSFKQLSVEITSGGDTGAGSVFDWQQHRWVHVDLSSGSAQLPTPNRFVSPQGQVMVRLQANSASGDLTISNVSQGVVLSGTGSTS